MNYYTAVRSVRGLQPTCKVHAETEFEAARNIYFALGWERFNLYNDRETKLLSRFDFSNPTEYAEHVVK